MKTSTLLVILLIFGGAAAEECTTPENKMVITKSTVFCHGDYFLPQGVSINADNIVLDCNNAVLRGDFSGSAITTVGRTGIDVRNCIIKDYENGFYFDNAQGYTVDDNTLSVITNRFVNITQQTEQKRKTNDETAEEQQRTEEQQNASDSDPIEDRQETTNWVENTVSQDSLREAMLTSNDVAPAVITKKYERLGNGTTVTTSIAPLDGVYTIYEIVPKTMAETADEITMAGQEFLTFSEDPVKVKLDVSLGKGLTFSYTTPGQGGEATTIVTAESKKEVIIKKSTEEQEAKLRRIFFVAVVIFFLAVYQCERTRAKKEGYRSKRNI